MPESFKIAITSFQPSQLYVNRAKLDTFLEKWPEGMDRPPELKPVSIYPLDGRLVIINGHNRVIGSLIRGREVMEAVWQEEKIDDEEFKIRVRWCRDEGVFSARQLLTRIVSPDAFESLWNERLNKMRQNLGQGDEF